MALEWVTWQIWTGSLIALLIIFLIIVYLQLRRVKDEIPKDVLESADTDSELSRDLTLTDITLLGVGAMIGAGIFVLTGDAAGFAGPGLMAVFLFNGFATGLTALVYAELGSAVPEAGGGYLWVKSSMGQYQAFLGGWMSWLAHIVAGSLYGIGFGSYFAFLLEEFHILPEGAHAEGFFEFTWVVGGAPIIDAKFGWTQIFALVIICLFLFINYLGSSETGAVGNIITVIKVVVIAIFIISGLWFAISAGVTHSFEKLEPVFPYDVLKHDLFGDTILNPDDIPNIWGKEFLPIFLAMGFTFIAFEGYEIIVQTGEEVQNPNTSIPKAIFNSLLIVVPIYFFVGLAALVAIDPVLVEGATPGLEDLYARTNGDPATWQILGELGEIGLAEVARYFMPLGVGLMLFGGLVSTLSALNATIYSSARVAFVMGRDKLLPNQFHEVNQWRRTPHWAIVYSGIIMVFIAVFLPLEDVAATADLLFVLLFLQVNISIFRIREKYKGKLFYGYQVPLYPLIPILAIIAQIALGIALILKFTVALIGAIIWLGGGSLLYFGLISPNLEADIRDAFEQYIRKGHEEE